MALHSRDAVTVSAAVATRSRMEGHTSLSTAQVWLTCQTPDVGGLIVCVCVCESVCSKTCRHIVRRMMNG